VRQAATGCRTAAVSIPLATGEAASALELALTESCNDVCTCPGYVCGMYVGHLRLHQSTIFLGNHAMSSFAAQDEVGVARDVFLYCKSDLRPGASVPEPETLPRISVDGEHAGGIHPVCAHVTLPAHERWLCQSDWSGTVSAEAALSLDCARPCLLHVLHMCVSTTCKCICHRV